LRLSTFERVVVANSGIIVLAAAAGWWITQHDPETYHYLIDTGFIALAASLCLVINFALLRAAFAPLRGVMGAIRAIEAGDLDARAHMPQSDADALALARAFNRMVDQLAKAREGVATRVLRAQEAERRRLALELHDQTGQSLTALTLHAEAIVRCLASEETDAAQLAGRQAERLAALAERTLEEVQALARQLRPPILDDLGLWPSLRWLAEDASERFGARVVAEVRVLGHSDNWHTAAADLAETEQDLDELPADFARIASADAGEQRLPNEIETALFRIAQESLTNAVRHGRAARVWIGLRLMPTRVTLTIIDDGGGFDMRRGPGATSQASAYGGIGIEGMRERARAVGGTLVVRSRPGHGTVVRAMVPSSGPWYLPACLGAPPRDP
jgi:two-component system sensor histidine kinase UhpB